MRPLVLTASLVVCLAADSSARAANAAKPLGDPHQDRPTLHSLGIYWIVRGDDNQNASVRLDYRKDGSARWRAAAPLFRVERRAHLTQEYGSRLDVPDDGWLFAGSVLMLDPGTAYEVKLTLQDPDGGSTSRTLKTQTRSEPRLSPRALKRYVVPGNGGGAGTRDDPFQGLAAAQKTAAPETCSCWDRESTKERGRFARAAFPNGQSSGAGKSQARRSSTLRDVPRNDRGRAFPRPAATMSGSRT